MLRDDTIIVMLIYVKANRSQPDNSHYSSNPVCELQGVFKNVIVDQILGSAPSAFFVKTIIRKGETLHLYNVVQLQ